MDNADSKKKKTTETDPVWIRLAFPPDIIGGLSDRDQQSCALVITPGNPSTYNLLHVEV